jgi:hypothetical protein
MQHMRELAPIEMAVAISVRTAKTAAARPFHFTYRDAAVAVAVEPFEAIRQFAEGFVIAGRGECRMRQSEGQTGQ